MLPRTPATVLLAAASGGLSSSSASGIKWVETTGIKYCGGGTGWFGFPPSPFGAGPAGPGGCPQIPAAWSDGKGVAACETLCAGDAKCLGFTWYPADPTHGGKNLTACCFRAGSVASKPKCAACTARCYEKPPPPPPPPAPPVPVSQREAMLWVYMHNESNTTVWDEYLSNFSRWMRPNVTSVSLCKYRCLPDGSFGYVGAPHNLADTGLNQECVPPWQIPRRPPRPTPDGTEPRVTPPSLCHGQCSCLLLVRAFAPAGSTAYRAFRTAATAPASVSSR